MNRDEYGHEVNEKYTFVPIRVAGVTHKNGRRSRQTILRQIYWKDEPYEKLEDENCIDLVATEYDGEPAVEVWVHSKKAREMIGYVPKKEAAFVAGRIEDLDTVFDFTVSGGGKTPDGEAVPYGAGLTIRLRNSTAPKADPVPVQTSGEGPHVQSGLADWIRSEREKQDRFLERLENEDKELQKLADQIKQLKTEEQNKNERRKTRRRKMILSCVVIAFVVLYFLFVKR